MAKVLGVDLADCVYMGIVLFLGEGLDRQSYFRFGKVYGI